MICKVRLLQQISITTILGDSLFKIKLFPSPTCLSPHTLTLSLPLSLYLYSNLPLPVTFSIFLRVGPLKPHSLKTHFGKSLIYSHTVSSTFSHNWILAIFWKIAFPSTLSTELQLIPLFLMKFMLEVVILSKLENIILWN